MKKLIVLLLILFSFTAYSQVYTKQPWYGLQVARVQADSVLTVPSGLGTLRQSFNSKQLRYNDSDSSLYMWTGFAWRKQGGGADSAIFATQYQIDTLQQTYDGVFADIFGRLSGKVRYSDSTTIFATPTQLAAKLNITDTANIRARLIAGSNITLSGTYPNITITGSAGGWGLTGNSGTTAANFIGTTDSRSFRFRTNNVERLVIDSIGNVGLGITPPTSLFHLSKSGINATQKDSFGITLSTPDAATSGNPKYSPPIVFAGKSFNTTTSASYDNLWRIYNKAASTVNFNQTGDLVFENSYNNLAYAERMRISGGAGAAQLVVPSIATNQINVSTGSTISFGSRIYVTENAANGLVGTLYIGGNPGSIAASAQLDVASTTKGFLPPRMTTVQRDAIGSPAAGLVIYNTSTNKHQGYNGSTWNDFY